MNNDVIVLRELAKQVALISSMDIMDDRRALWAAHNAFKKVRTPIYIRDGHWSKEIIEPLCVCENELLQQVELYLRKMIYQYEVGDDFVIENYVKIPAVLELPGYGPWGVNPNVDESDMAEGCKKIHAALEDIADLSSMSVPKHKINEKETAEQFELLSDMIGDIIPVITERSPHWIRWGGDISTHLGYLLGTEGLMWAIYDNPKELHALLAFMRDGVIKAHDEAEAAGDFSLLSHENQSMPYIEGLEGPNGRDKKVERSSLWNFHAAQEFTLVSPEHHKEFMLDYQIPIMEKYAYSSYGCCEDLTKKIDMLRNLKNLRRIAVSPFADERSCAEQIGKDYIASWRPDPATTVCLGFDAEDNRKILKKAKKAFEDNDCLYDICLKDVHTIGRDYNRLIEFTKVAREVVES